MPERKRGDYNPIEQNIFNSLPIAEQARLKTLISSGVHEPSTASDLLLPQTEGLRRLYAFLHLGSSFSSLAPFVMDISQKNPAAREDYDNPMYGFYMGGSNKFLTFTVPNDLMLSTGLIWAFPRTLNRGDQAYFWLDLYKAQEQDKQASFNAARLLPNAPKEKYNFKGWHGIEEQLLADFILGGNNISFNDLLPVSLDAKQKAPLANYRLASQKGLTICLYPNALIQEGDRLLLYPRRDPQGLYEWLDVLKIMDGSENRIVSSFQILREKKALTAQGWFGYEKQLLIDYLSNQNGIQFENLVPIRATLSPKMECISIAHTRNTSGLSLDIYLPKGSVAPGEEVVILPKQDERKMYQWLEVFKIDPVTHNPIGECIAAVQVKDGAFQQKTWQGPELELLRDYTKGIVDFTTLVPITFKLAKGKDLIHLWREGEKRGYLVLSKDFKLEDGDRLVLTPDEDPHFGQSFLLKRDDQILGRYKFDPNERKFQMIINFIANTGPYFTYERESNSYLDMQGRSWLTRSEIAKRFRMSNPSKILEDVSTARFKGSHADKTVDLFLEEEVNTRAAKKGINKLQGWAKSTSKLRTEAELWVYTDTEGTWISAFNVGKLFNFVKKGEIRECINKVRQKTIRDDSGRKAVVFSLTDLESLEEVQNYFQRPIFDTEVEPSKHEWVPIEKIAEIYGVPRSTLKLQSFFEKISTREGIKQSPKGKRATLLYNLFELDELPEFNEFLKRRENASDEAISSQDADEELGGLIK